MRTGLTSYEIEDVKAIAESDIAFDKLRNKRLLISGGTGFIGGFLLDVIDYRNRVHGDHIEVIVLSRRGGVDEDLIRYVAQDVTLPFDVDEKVDFVLHLASNTHPSQYKSDPVGTITANVFGCDNLLKIARKSAAKFLLASSVEIYGNGATEPIKESFCGYIDCNTARAGYNEAKRVCESLCASYSQQYGVGAVIARLARVFGADRKKDSKALAQFFDKAVRGEDIVLNSAGNQRFSYCYVADAVSGILKLLVDWSDGQAYNVSDDDDGGTLRDYATYISSIANVKLISDIKKDAFASKADYAILDCSKLKAIGWSPRYTVKEGMRRTYEILNTVNSELV